TANGTAASPTWTQVDTNAPGLPNRYVMRITIDRNSANTVYVTFGGFSPDNVWRTTDAGSSWSDRTGSGSSGLPDAPVRSLVIHPSNSNWLYVGAEVSVFVSENAGVNWTVPHEGPANVSVDELFWMNTALVAATHGRGLYRAETVGQACYDFDHNGQVDALDITAVASRWRNAALYNPTYDVAAPFGVIDIIDIVTVSAHWGLSC
ncbi:MAG: hypothetical protein WAV53_02335, partial [Anaerolineae bacterium]